MPITVNGKFYKTKKMCYINMNPDNTQPTQNEICLLYTSPSPRD